MLLQQQENKKPNTQINFLYCHDPKMKMYLLFNRIHKSVFFLNRQMDHSPKAKHATQCLVASCKACTDTSSPIHCPSEDDKANLPLLAGTERDSTEHLFCITQSINCFSLPHLLPAGNPTLVSVLVPIFVFHLITCKSMNIVLHILRMFLFDYLIVLFWKKNKVFVYI